MIQNLGLPVSASRLNGAAAAVPQRRPSAWARIGGLLAPSGLPDEELEALGRTGLLHAGLGILANNYHGSAGPAIGAGLLAGAQAATQRGTDLLDRRQKERKQAAVNASAGNVQSRFVGDDGKVYVLLRNGNVQDTGIKADRQMWLRDHPGMEPTLVGKDAIERPLLGAAAPPLQPQPTLTGPDGMPINIGADLPDAVKQSILADPSAWQALPDGAQAQLPDQQVQAFNPAPIYNRPPASRARPSAAQEAASVEAARQAVQMQYLPQQQAIETQGAIDRARGTEQAKADVERASAEEAKRLGAMNTLDLLGEAERILPNATGSAIGRVRDIGAGAVGVSTEGAQGTAQLQTIAGQLIGKMPRFEGPQSDKDVQLYRQMAGDLANPWLPVETRQAALRTIRALNEKAARQSPGRAPETGAQGRALRYNPATGDFE